MDKMLCFPVFCKLQYGTYWEIKFMQTKNSFLLWHFYFHNKRNDNETLQKRNEVQIIN